MKLLSFVGDEEEAEEEVEFQKKPIYRPERKLVTSVTINKLMSNWHTVVEAKKAKVIPDFVSQAGPSSRVASTPSETVQEPKVRPCRPFLNGLI